MIKLFICGVLEDAKVQQLMYQREVQSEDAILENHTRDTQNPNGIIKKSNHIIQGKVIYLKQHEILLTDQWFGVPHYHKTVCKVKVNDSFEEVLAYLKSGEQIEITQQDVKTFVRHVDNEVVASDMYFLVPVKLDNFKDELKSYSKNHVIGNEFLQTYRNIISEECNEDQSALTNRIFLGEHTISITNEGEKESTQALLYLAYSTIKPETYGALYISVSVPNINPILLWSRIYGGYFKIDGTSLEEFLELNKYNEVSLKQIGHFKCACFTAEQWTTEQKQNLFAAEYNNVSICNKSFDGVLSNNIAQYSTAEIYANEMVVLETPAMYKVSILDRMHSQILTLLLVELFSLQFAISNEAKRKLKKSIETATDLKKNDQLHDLVTKTFWDTEYLKYPTSRNLMTDMGNALNTDKLQKAYIENIELLSRVSKSYENSRKEKNDDSLNLILLFLTLVSIFPVITDLIREVMSLSPVFSYISSGTACVTIFVAYNIITKK